MKKLSDRINALVPVLVVLFVFATIISTAITLLDYTYATFFITGKNLVATGHALSINVIDGYRLLNSVFSDVEFIIGIIVIGYITAAVFIRKMRSDYNTVATLIYLFNPFIYSRLISGQMGMVMAYLLLPMTVYYLSRLWRQATIRKIIIVALTFTVVGTLQVHFLYMLSIIYIVYLLIHKEYLLRTTDLLKSSVLLIILVLLLNAYWLQGTFSVPETSIDTTDASFFAPKLSDGISAIAKITGMWGFWREGSYITTYTTLPLVLWYTLTAMFVITMLIGYYATRDKDNNVKVFYALWWIGLLLAVGISHPWTAPIFNFMFNYVPFFNGFRDSHKFVALIALAYAFLCPLGVMWLANEAKQLFKSKRLRQGAFYAVPTLFVAGVILYTYPLIGLWGQVQPTQYPEAYGQTNEFFKAQNITGHIVYLPYYDYLTYNWTLKANPDGRIANPINKVVEPIVITNPGPWGAQTNKTLAVGTCLSGNNISCLEAQDVQYVLLDKCYIDFDKLNFTWLPLPPVHTTDCVDVYELQQENVIDRTIRVPLRFIIGSTISALTLVALLLYLWKPQLFRKQNKLKRKS